MCSWVSPVVLLASLVPEVFQASNPDSVLSRLLRLREDRRFKLDALGASQREHDHGFSW
jgi:hypothetical protein